MNLILFEQPFEVKRLPGTAPEAAHLIRVLKVTVGSRVFVGFINGLRARTEVTSIETDGSVTLKVVGTEPAPKPLPIRLLVGLPRPHTAKRLLFEAASLGVGALHFFEAERSEPSYALSSLWTTEQWKERLRLGVEQSFGTYLPEVGMHADLQSAITFLGEVSNGLTLDNYEATAPLPHLLNPNMPEAVLALGPERGWSGNERVTFIKNGWKLAHLGPHVLRVETACAAAVSVAAAALGGYDGQTRSLL